MRPLVKMIFVSLLVIIMSSMAYAQQIGSQVESLRGLKGVCVLVEKLQPSIEADGLRVDSIKTDAELKLRLAGIKVLTEEEWRKEPGSPFLYIVVGDKKDEWGLLYACGIHVELHQIVFLSRNPEILVSDAITWRTGRLRIVGETEVDTSVRDNIKDEMDNFINDYLSVNPK